MQLPKISQSRVCGFVSLLMLVCLAGFPKCRSRVPGPCKALVQAYDHHQWAKSNNDSTIPSHVAQEYTACRLAQEWLIAPDQCRDEQDEEVTEIRQSIENNYDWSSNIPQYCCEIFNGRSGYRCHCQPNNPYFVWQGGEPPIIYEECR